MSYTRPPYNAADASWAGAPAYTRPAYNAADASWPPDAAEAVVDFSIDVTFEVEAEFTNVAVEAVVAFTVDVSAEVEAAHGVAGTAAFTIGVDAAAEGAHGIAGTVSFAVEVTAEVVAQHSRYVLKGEVRDGGILVNRTVRAYRRDTGVLIGEQFTDAGRFNIHAGFEEREHYLLPINLDGGAVDFTPPATNRVLSELAMD